jgi:hypothetical protein
MLGDKIPNMTYLSTYKCRPTKQINFWENLALVPLRQPRISHDLTRDWKTRGPAVINQGLKTTLSYHGQHDVSESWLCCTARSMMGPLMKEKAVLLIKGIEAVQWRYAGPTRFAGWLCSAYNNNFPFPKVCMLSSALKKAVNLVKKCIKSSCWIFRGSFQLVSQDIY